MAAPKGRNKLATQTTTLRVGTIVPLDSKWHQILQDMGQRWRIASKEKITLKFFVGTLGAIPLYLVLSRLGPGAYVAFTAALVALGVLAAERAARYWGVADASPIVIDEVAGYLVTLALVPFSWQAVAAGFVLFRIFDVLKPWPASAFDRVKNGFGVVMDDVAAGCRADRCGMTVDAR